MASVLVRTPLGSVIGKQCVLPNKKPCYAFCGIPYAKPPLGELRFQPPVPLEKFPKTVMDCTNEGNVAFQRENLTKMVIGNEDCLFLNIYSPEVPHTSGNSFPVMFFIHGGGFMTGHGGKEFYSPEYLVQEDVVVVTINYRVGPFGFLSLPNAGISGNAGLKDQLLALKFVNQYIENFCGDPKNVTVFGESSGSASVHMHYMNKNSRKYFHKAICQSGVIFNEWVWQHNSQEKAYTLAERLGFKSKSKTTDEEVAEFLSQAPAEEMAAEGVDVLDTSELCRSIPMAFRAVIEKDDAAEAFITYNLLDNYKRHNTSDIPIMIGYNTKEGMLLLPFRYKVEMLLSSFPETLPRSLNLTIGSKASKSTAAQIKHFYFGTNPVSEENLDQIVDILSDYYFNVVFAMTAEIHARYQHKSKLYFYRFGYDGELNIAKKVWGTDRVGGATHADELFYLFTSQLMGEDYEVNEEAQKMRFNMCKMWTNFAKYGEPTPDGDENFPEKWTPVKCIHRKALNFNLNFYDITKELKMKTNPDWERILFWRGIYERWNEGFLKPKL